MWLLGHVADQLLAGDVKGAQEMLALAMVAIEQSAMDNGKWEIAWILASQEDPSQQLFAHRAPATNPRLRAFGPLCPADWGAIALAYVKELDPLSSRRAEALPRKQGAKSEDLRKMGRPIQSSQSSHGIPEGKKLKEGAPPQRQHEAHKRGRNKA